MYYVDKTMYIPMLEDQDANLIFIRPRRFGKSLFLSMIAAYYDIALKSRFDELFGNLYISSHPTSEQGRYQVLWLDFSRIGGTIDEMGDNFNNYCALMLDAFIRKYKDYYGEGIYEEIKKRPYFGDKLQIIVNEAKQNGFHLYLIIDEYDNFTNVVLNEHGEKVYRAMTHASGFYRDAFKKFKGVFQRIFMIGVSPVTMDDLTSGFNIASNISTNPLYNQMLGFSENDVTEMLEYYKSQGKLKADANIPAIIEDMKPWYDNYCFAKESLSTDAKMFNSDMVLYYVRIYMQMGKSPDSMLDQNTRTDYNKMRKLIDMDHLDGDRRGIIRKIAEEGKLYAEINPSFPAVEMTKAENFISLLFYYGMLTITGTRGYMLELGIPNNNVRKQYYEFMLEQYSENPKDAVNTQTLNLLYYDMAYEGNMLETFRYIARQYSENSSVRSSIEGERNIQGFFTAYLSICNYYLIAPEVEMNHGYADLFLMPDLQRFPDMLHSCIVEIKYLSVKDYDSQAESQWNDAVQQIARYAQGRKVQQMCQGTTLHKVILQFKGWECARMEEV